MKAPRLALLLCLAGCQAKPTGAPRPSSVTVTFSNPGAVPLPPYLRLALVFTYGNVLVPATELLDVDTGASATLPLVTPMGDWETGLDPVETVTFPSLATIDVFRPRILLYEDTDVSGAPSLADHIFAIDTTASGATVAAVLDLDVTLARMTYEESQSYYAATGGLYTPFLRVMGSRGFLQLVDGVRAGSLTLKLSDSPIPAEHLRCGRDPVYLSGDPLSPSERVTVHVDAGVDRASFCGSTLPDCTQEALAGGTAPELTPVLTEGHRRVAMCRQNADVQTLVVQTATMTCASCSCTYERNAEVWVVSPGSPPPWWPCGAGVRVCTSSLPLYQIDAACVPTSP